MIQAKDQGKRRWLLKEAVLGERSSAFGATGRVGRAITRHWDAAVVVALADQPNVGAGSIGLLRQAHAAGAVAAVATYDGKPRNPVLLSRTVWAEVAALAEGDTGARPWLRAHPELVVEVPCDATGSPEDVDTPADLAALEALA